MIYRILKWLKKIYKREEQLELEDFIKAESLKVFDKTYLLNKAKNETKLISEYLRRF